MEEPFSPFFGQKEEPETSWVHKMNLYSFENEEANIEVPKRE